MKWIRLAILLCVLLLGSSSWAGSDPSRVWFTLETEHFAVHSYDQGEPLARRVAGFAEEAYRIINPLIGSTPKERIHIKVVDDVDSANGYASVVPYSAITILASPPLPDETLSSYTDWLRLLVFHEYAHVVHLNQVSGLPGFLNSIFGKNFAPNQSLPRWLTEGIATWVESRTSSAGRLNSSRFNMLLRTHSMSDRVPALAELTGVPLTPPGATLWYLYGCVMIDEIVRGAGEEGLRRFTETYGRRIIPYGINLAFQETTGKNLKGWYDSMRQRIKDESDRTLAAIQKEGLREGRALTQSGFYKHSLRFSPDGRELAFVRADGHRMSRLVALDASHPAKERKLITCRGGCGDFDFSRDGQWILLSSNRHHRRVNVYRELVEIDATQRSTMRDARVITQAARLQHLALQKDGTRVWGVASGWGKTWLEARHSKDGTRTFQWRPSGYERVSHPAPAADGRSVFFSMHAKGNHDLYRLTLRSRRLERLTYGSAIEFNLRVSPDGKWLLYTSDATGIYNIYARNIASGHTFRLTHVRTGAFSPEVSPDGKTLVYVGWTVEGQEIYTMPFLPTSGLRVSVPDPRPPHPTPQPQTTRIRKMPYSPLNSILPRSILPTLAGDLSGAASFGLYLGNIDVSERLGGSLYFMYDATRSDYSLETSLRIETGWPDISLTLGRYTFDDVTYVADRLETYREEVLYGSADVSIGFPSVTMPISLNGGVTVEGYRSADGFEARHAPDENSSYIPTEGVSPRLHLGWGFGNVSRSSLNISPSEGVSGYVGFGLRHRLFGSHATLFNVDYRLSAYVPMPWHPDHVWLSRVEGGWRGGEPEDVRAYRLGGVPPTNLLMDVVNLTQNAGVWLRGFSPDALVGTSYYLLVQEYRFPLLRGRTGLDALPIYINDLHGALFVDAGVVSEYENSAALFDEIAFGIGGELRLDVEVLFGLSLNLRVGYAYGFGHAGGHQLYFFLAPPP